MSLQVSLNFSLHLKRTENENCGRETVSVFYKKKKKKQKISILKKQKVSILKIEMKSLALHQNIMGKNMFIYMKLKQVKIITFKTT